MKIVYPLAIAAALLMAGCIRTPILYVPPPAHISTGYNGAADVSLLIGTDQNSMRGAWSPVERLELFALASYHNSMSDSSEHAYHVYQEAGAGWYFGAGTSTTFSLQAGFGWGHAKGFGNLLPEGGTTQLYEASGNYIRPFAGLGIAYSSKVDTTAAIERRQFGFAARVAYVDFPRIHGQPGVEKGHGWYFEPTFMMRAGGQEAQVESQFGFSSVYSSAGIESVDLLINFGMQLQLDRLF